jgi:uridine phosphorylase
LNFAPGLLTAEAIVQWKKEKGVLSIPVPPKVVILTTQAGLLKYFRALFSNKWLRGLMGRNLCIDSKNGIYLSTGWGVGSPAMISVCEEWRVLGAQSFYLVGIAGRLSGWIKEGEAILALDALCEEGTSRFYRQADAPKQVSAPGHLSRNLQQLQSSRVVSVDAPYRETQSAITQWQQSGAELVDMETSALYSFASYYGLNAAAIVIGADSLANDKWTMARNMTSIGQAQRNAIKLILETERR